MNRSKAAAETAGAESLASAIYNAASAAERDGRERHQSGQFGQAAARFYEAAGLFRSAEIAARGERAAREEQARRDEQARRADEAAKARQSEARPPPPRAEEPAGPPAEQLVREVIARYTGALQARSMEELRRLWPTMTAAQQRAIRSEFDNARSIRVEVINPHIEVGGDTATATFLRRYELLTSDGRRLQTDTKTTIVLRKTGGSWLIDDVRHQSAR
jgi:ketosteroid isomerase-like protein